MYRLTVCHKNNSPEPLIEEKPLASQENLMIGISHEVPATNAEKKLYKFSQLLTWQTRPETSHKRTHMNFREKITRKTPQFLPNLGLLLLLFKKCASQIVVL